MDFVISHPEFSREGPESVFVVLPVSVKFFRSVLASLNHCPACKEWRVLHMVFIYHMCKSLQTQSFSNRQTIERDEALTDIALSPVLCMRVKNSVVNLFTSCFVDGFTNDLEGFLRLLWLNPDIIISFEAESAMFVYVMTVCKNKRVYTLC